MINKSKIKFEYILSVNDYRINELNDIAATFFGTTIDDKQIPATIEATKHALDIGAIYTIAMLDDNLVGWGVSIPMNLKSMYDFLNYTITEADMFWNHNSSTYDCIYFISIYIKPEFRTFYTARRLIINSIEPLLRNNIPIFYDAFTNEGKIMGNFLKRHFKNNPIYSRM